ncbi:dTDP-4-dehydrorhamnose reductase [uncultured Pseudokineococcus sp.]|uniref:dTDP-4-dehydrorhamnose reductase n=1 Tax=uncultured Pseudokineococcus sp. TaxID=1642928 RepID=UPI0026113B4D|nr:dTDP-4-dehydrorhamnose reductase [uncultured Pseudokineococcus sp.]
MTTRWAVVGASGMLGREVVRSLRTMGEEVVALSRADLDVTDVDASRQLLKGNDVIINASAWTAVDDAERAEAAAFSVNAIGARNLAAAASSTGARLVHVSTDYVFDGRARDPYAEAAPTAPRSAYGRTKLAGEWAVAATCPDHLIVRTAWLYGDGRCFPRTIARLLGQRETVSVVEDQHGQPTWTRDVGDLLVRLVVAGAPSGVYHGTASGRGTWRDLAQEVARSIGADPERVLPTTSDNFPTPAERPAWSVLGHRALLASGIEPIPDWRERWRLAAGEVLALSEA